ncbi:type II toxin-antitoxin system RelB/DinJ family antitoxin [uncultured Devosia sp.]|uniref:type II toxin-antitoxin system RelB/DinJ family antitoxin n=1 Tax=uncultured Devosia sp. TaxID=211434 RepID=UPI0035CA3D09
MPANALIQTRIDRDVKERASEVLAMMGLSVSDAVRILLTKVANEGALPFNLTSDPQEYDRWFRAKVQEALDDPHPGYSSEEVETFFAEKRAATRRALSAK